MHGSFIHKVRMTGDGTLVSVECSNGWHVDFDEWGWSETEVTPKIPVRLLTDYPHACPRCGERCYIGLNKVEHYDPFLDGACQ